MPDWPGLYHESLSKIKKKEDSFIELKKIKIGYFLNLCLI